MKSTVHFSFLFLPLFSSIKINETLSDCVLIIETVFLHLPTSYVLVVGLLHREKTVSKGVLQTILTRSIV